MRAEENDAKINKNFDELWTEKKNLYTDPGTQDKRFKNFQDLWKYKQSISTSIATTGVRYTIEDIANPDKAEDNAKKINELFVDLWIEKEDD
jgi:hypothetical protein